MALFFLLFPDIQEKGRERCVCMVLECIGIWVREYKSFMFKFHNHLCVSGSMIVCVWKTGKQPTFVLCNFSIQICVSEVTVTECERERALKIFYLIFNPSLCVACVYYERGKKPLYFLLFNIFSQLPSPNLWCIQAIFSL